MPRSRRNARWAWVAASVACCSTACWSQGGHGADPTETLDLAGPWQLALDPEGTGKAAGWEHPTALAPYVRTATLPGSLDAQGIGDPVDLHTPWVGESHRSGYYEAPRFAPYRPPHEAKLPFWLTPQTHYVGAAWRRRTIQIPTAWRERRIVLRLERCHWGVEAWIDGHAVGRGDSLSTPHEFDLTPWAEPGEHTLVLCVDNRLQVNVGPNAHSVSDHTQGNWNGVIGEVQLHAMPRVWIKTVRLEPDLAARGVHATIRLGNVAGRSVAGAVTCRIRLQGAADAPAFVASTPATVAEGETEVALFCHLGENPSLWDEFSPQLYTASVTWQPDPPDVLGRHEVQETVGMREVAVDGTQAAINGRPRFLRGTLDCCVFPLTGHPPMDVQTWRRVLQTCRSHGLNHVRFHSYCPPRAAFVAADELGVYLQVEAPAWANQGVELGGGQPIDEYLQRESARILEAYGNHPSFVLMASGNEPAGDRQTEYLTDWVTRLRRLDGRRLYTGASGWPSIDANQFHVVPEPRIHAWGQGLGSRINARPPETQTDYREYVARRRVPVVAHEIGQWCVFPNFAEIPKYRGHLKAKNFEIFADLLREAGMGAQAYDFLMASGKLQTLCYKEEIESALRTPGFGGFQLLGLSDFSGQGTALVGVLDAFWDSKPYVTPEEYRRFAGPVVPLARLAKRTYVAGETLVADVDLANYGPRDLSPAQARWQLVDVAEGCVLGGGQLEHAAPAGALTRLGTLTALLDPQASAAQLKLTVEGDGWGNDWDLWVYPQAPVLERPEVVVATQFDDATRARLAAGERVLLIAAAEQVKTDVQLGFSPIFWNTSWTENQPPHTLGILCDPHRPALAGFPTEPHANWQWWELIHGAAALDLTQANLDVEPLVQAIPDWFAPRRLALAIEARVGPGRLLIVSANLTADQERRPAARQFKHSLLAYMASDRFAPQVELKADEVQRLFHAAPHRADY